MGMEIRALLEQRSRASSATKRPRPKVSDALSARAVHALNDRGSTELALQRSASLQRDERAASHCALGSRDVLSPVSIIQPPKKGSDSIRLEIGEILWHYWYHLLLCY